MLTESTALVAKETGRNMLKKPYRSKFEARCAADLKRRKVEFEYEPTRIPYHLALDCKYTPDFELDNGIFVETKGRFVAADRRKHLAIRAQHPELDIRLVFMRNNTLSKVSKTKYSDWCDKNGFKWAIGVVPEAWIKETK